MLKAKVTEDERSEKEVSKCGLTTVTVERLRPIFLFSFSQTDFNVHI